MDQSLSLFFAINPARYALDLHIQTGFYPPMLKLHRAVNIFRQTTLAAVLGTGVLSGFAHAKTDHSKTVGSTSLCGDSYVLALAPDLARELSWQSRSALSRAGPEQRVRPQLWDDVEVVAASASDVILFGSGEGAFAERLGKESIKLTWGEDFPSVIDNVQALASALGRPDNLTRDITARLTRLNARTVKRGTKPKVLYLARSGGSAGTGTLVDAVIKAAGGENALARNGLELRGWVSPGPEILLEVKPDLIVTSYFKHGYESVNAAALRNKTLSAYIQSFPSVHIGGALWPCAGPGLIEAAEILADAMDALP